MTPVLVQSEAEPRCYVLTRTSVVARGVMLAGIIWEVDAGTNPKSRVTECIIVWFAMFSHHDLVFDLTEGER